MELKGETFKNSPTCEGAAYVDSEALIDMSKIDITGRYPESGWAVNEVTHEMVFVARGIGSLAIKGQQVTHLSEGTVVSVAPGKRFAWEGDMTLIMSCNPPFSSDQYKVEEE